MSRSYRNPCAAVTSAYSAHDNKKTAARGLRRRLKQWLKILQNPEAELIPHRFECPHNNAYAWDRDRRYRVYPHIPNPDHGSAYRRWIKLRRK